jgi:aspartate racemase
VTLDFDEVEKLQHGNEGDRLGNMLADAAQRLERAGADLVVLCTNTMHKLADHITRAVRIPLLHIVDATGDEIKRSDQRRAGLLGTKFTMEDPFYRDRLRQQFEIDTIIPPAADRRLIHEVIYGELCHGVIRDESRRAFQAIISRLAARGAQCVILGCTEIPLLISPSDSSLPIYDSTAIHARKAVDFAVTSQTSAG